jgi:hypothetical protein
MVGIVVGFVGFAACSVGGGIFRIELNRLVRVGDGAVIIAFTVIGVAAVFVGESKLRIEPRRLITFGDRAVVIALAGGKAAVVVRRSIARIERVDASACGDLVRRPFDLCTRRYPRLLPVGRQRQPHRGSGT